ncbi:hypothetical protein LCGC14_2467450, partial [marine sediment metagenome]
RSGRLAEGNATVTYMSVWKFELVLVEGNES